MDRRQVRPLNKNDDIAGSGPDTLKRGLVGKRVINPLEPNYFYPGGTENINTVNDPYGTRNSSMSQANFYKAATFGVQALKEPAAADVEAIEEKPAP